MIHVYTQGIYSERLGIYMKKILLCRLEQSQEHQKQFVRQAEW